MQVPTVNLERIRKRLEKLALIGKQPGGGITRLSYSKEWKQATALIEGWMQEIGMETTIDAVGNLFGRYEGQDSSLPVIMTGSHIDTVPRGGALDGALGIVAGLEVANCWKENCYVPRKALEVVATVEEESTLFGVGCLGSRVIIGDFEQPITSTLVDQQGKTFGEYLRDCQLDPAEIGRATKDGNDIDCFLELHIEQGCVLDNRSESIGIVTEIVGIRRITFNFFGTANHAGTTPMDKRADSLLAASHFVVWANEEARSSGGELVVTIGKLESRPGKQNVIPEETTFTLEIRSPYSSMFKSFADQVKETLNYIEIKYNVRCRIIEEKDVAPVKLSSKIRQVIKNNADDLQLEALTMPSWAGHDAKIFSFITSSGLIFVPSKDGISHSPHEYTDWEQIAEGVALLNRTLVELSE